MQILVKLDERKEWLQEMRILIYDWSQSLSRQLLVNC